MNAADRTHPAAMFCLHGVDKAYPDGFLLHIPELTLRRGGTTVLIGPSGCGKSTLLHLLLGLEAPDRGTLSLDDTPLTPVTIGALRRRMGFVAQDGGLFPHLTAAANVGLMATYSGWAHAQVEARITELASLARLPRRALDRYPTQLSGGQRQRVSLMRALMLDPDVLLLDEPLGALDPLVRYELQTDLKAAFARLAKTVVLVTHDLAEAGLLGDWIVLLREGRIVQQGTMAELLDRPRDSFVSRFVNAQRAPLSALQGDRPPCP